VIRRLYCTKTRIKPLKAENPSRIICFEALKARNDANLFRPLGRKDLVGVGGPGVAREARLPRAILFHAVGVMNPPTNAGGSDKNEQSVISNQ
jgi:hypothetical protein